MARFPTKSDLLSKLLTKYAQFLPAPEFQDVKARAQHLEELSPTIVEEIRDLCVSALQAGMPDILRENIVISKYSPFSEAVASEVVGEINVEVKFVVKVGGEELKRQIESMKNQGSTFRGLYPEIYEEQELQGSYACIMELLYDYFSLHKMIFRKCAKNQLEVQRALDCTFANLERIYLASKNSFNLPNLAGFYARERILQKVIAVSQDIDKWLFLTLGYSGVLRGGFEALRDCVIRVDGNQLRPYNECAAILEERINDRGSQIGLGFTTIVHGDAHPGNIMIKILGDSCQMKFLDPNPCVVGDYLYDMAKMVHWLDKVGLLILERETEQTIINVDVDDTGSIIEVNYGLTDKIQDSELKQEISIQEICNLKDWALKYVYMKTEALANILGDTGCQSRMELALAAAYFGALVRLTEPTHLVVAFVEGLKHLNSFLFTSN